MALISSDSINAVRDTANMAEVVGQYTDLGINRSLPRYVPEADVRLGRAGVGLAGPGAHAAGDAFHIEHRLGTRRHMRGFGLLPILLL